MLNSCQEYSKLHGYVIHPEKSTVTELIRDTNQSQLAWKLGESYMNKTQSFTHLGLEWSSGNMSPNIEGRIKIARRTTYALMGTGLHGANGMSPVVAVKIINTYVIPRLLYGLDAAVLNRKQIEQINMYHRNLLRQIQGLPKSTAIEFIYLLSGTLPVEAELDVRRLTLFGAVCRGAETNSTLRKLAQRQLSLENKHSWFQLLIATAVKYSINIEAALETPWSKYLWKQYVNKAVRDHWFAELTTSKKSSLEILNKGNVQAMTPHPIWKVCTNHPRLVPFAVTRARLLSNTYMTQRRKSKISRGLPPTCQLCGKAEEDRNHFLLECPATSHIRRGKILKLYRLDFRVSAVNPLRDVLNGPHPTHRRFHEINTVLNELCHTLHSDRLKQIKSISFSSGEGSSGETNSHPVVLNITHNLDIQGCS